jgi:hypothetical protein
MSEDEAPGDEQDTGRDEREIKITNMAPPVALLALPKHRHQARMTGASRHGDVATVDERVAEARSWRRPAVSCCDTARLLFCRVGADDDPDRGPPRH